MKANLTRLLLLMSLFFFGISVQAQHLEADPQEGCVVYTPNAFTPNGDGINDFFYLTFKDQCTPARFNLQIIDRWGRLVFETSNYTEKWDGTFEGHNLQSGAYFWVMRTDVNLPDQENQQIEKNGTLLLIK